MDESTPPMKSSSTLCLVIIGLLLVFITSTSVGTALVTSGSPDEPLAEWETLTVPAEYYDSTFDEIEFINETHGWLLGWDVLLSTTDGGESWDVLSNSINGSFFGLSIIDPLNIWLGARLDEPLRYGQLLHSLDGGVSWIFANTPDPIVKFVEFYNNTHGLAAGANQGYYNMFRTVNGGNSWQESNWSYPYPRDFHLTASTIRVTTFDGIIISEDWGLTWEVELPKGTALSFITENDGWVIHHPTISHFNGGTWTELPRVARITVPTYPSYRDIEFIDSEHGWIVGKGPSIIYTPNGGKSWYEQEVADCSLNTVDFINESHGWVAGWRGAVLRTKTGNLLGPALYSGVFIRLITGGGFIVPFFSLMVGTISVAVSSVLVVLWRFRIRFKRKTNF